MTTATLARIPGDLRDYNQHLLAALHEGSHAVVTVLLGGTVESVDANRTTRAASCPLTGWPVAVLCMAGAAGARMFGPRHESPSRHASSQDGAVADTMLDSLGLHRAHKRRATEEAEALLRFHERAVRAVARGIMERGSLSGARVEAIVRGEPLEDAQVVEGVKTTVDSSAEPARVVARAWPLRAGGWCANTDPAGGADPRLSQVEGIGPDMEGALDALGIAAAGALGCRVSLSTVEEEADA
ncbi:MAG: hypothetical protein Q8N53_16855 [Longimicrobiales bacterium]|nr:hypothetical protein [Longimicrobiales bacterium]